MSGTKLKRVGPQHYIIFLLLLFGIAIPMQMNVIPGLIQGFVLSQFAPHDRESTLVYFSNGVVGTANVDNTKSDEVRELTVKGADGADRKVTFTKKDGHWVCSEPSEGAFLNKEYLFDFTTAERKEKETVRLADGTEESRDLDGYGKAAVASGLSGEWYVAARELGEHAIILQPWGFSILSLVIGFLGATLITLILPPSIGFISQKISREIVNTKTKIRLQTGLSNETVELLTMLDRQLEKLNEEQPEVVRRVFRRVWDRTIPEQELNKSTAQDFESFFDAGVDVVAFRHQILMTRIREFFSEAVATEIENVCNAQAWEKNQFKVFAALRLYMVHHFTERYSNNVTGFAYGGAAFLIIAVGIRGLKFIPAARPSLILLAILLEFSLLALLAVTLYYTEEEERMDKMLKKMEDASRNQLETLERVSIDMHKFTEALEGGMADQLKDRIMKAVEQYVTNDDNVRKAVATAIGEQLVIGTRKEK